MNQMQHQVQKFHEATHQPNGLATQERRELRAKLIMEEAVETVAALGFAVEASIINPNAFPPFSYDKEGTIAEYAKHYTEYHYLDFIDGLCDLLYVTVGGAVNLGLDIQPHFNEVHRANMNKLTGPKREDGKQLKPEGWQPPDHQRIIEEYPSDTLGGHESLGEEIWNARVPDAPLVNHTNTPEAQPTVSLWDAATTVTSASPPPGRD